MIPPASDSLFQHRLAPSRLRWALPSWWRDGCQQPQPHLVPVQVHWEGCISCPMVPVTALWSLSSSDWVKHTSLSQSVWPGDF